MCHESLKIDFNLDDKNCFFIGGSNGSGKSALFAALNIGLGGRGSQNERGNSLKQYIKDGQNRSKIRIVLTNRGLGRHPDYGDAIAVERIMNLTSSTYCLKSITFEDDEHWHEELVSRKKADLDKILLRFSIHLDNPIFWMSQNRCREFLQDLKPNKLYEMFMCATGLDYSRQWYDESATYTAESEKLVLSIREACHNKNSEISKLHEERKCFKGLEKSRRNLSELKKILPWLPVRDCFKDLCKHEELLKKAISVHESLCDGIVAKKEMLAEFDQKLNEILEEKRNMQNEVTVLQAELNELEKSKTCRREKMLDTGHQLSAVERKLRLMDAEIISMEQQLKDIEAKENQNTKAQHSIADTEAELFALEQRCKMLKEKQKQAEERKHNFEAKLLEALKTERTLEAEISNCNGVLRELHDEGQRAKAMEKNKLARFGASVPQIVNLIEKNASKFRRKPIGPLGAYIRVIDNSWAVAIEQCLRELLSTFLCDNARDRNVLESILKQHNINSRNCIITKFVNNRYNVALYEPPSNYVTVAKMLVVTDDNVFNALVDQTRMECTLLFECDSLARSVMAVNPPRNVSKGFTKNGDEVYAKRDNQVYRFYANYRKVTSSVLVSTDPVNLEELTKAITKAKDELRHNIASLKKAREKREEIEMEINNETRQVAQLLNEMQVDEAKRRSLQKVLDNARFEGNIGGQVMNLISNLDQYRNQKEELVKTGKALQEELTNLRQKVHDVEVLRIEKAKDLNEKEKDVQRIEANLDETSLKKDELKNYEAEHCQKLEKLEKHRTDLENEVKAIKEKLEQMRADAEKSVPGDAPDFEDLPDTTEAEKLYKRLQNRIQAAEESFDIDKISDEALNALQVDLKRLLTKYTSAKKIILEMKDKIKMKNEKFLEVRNITAERLNDVYSRLMSLRNFKGSLILDHREKCIYIKAETQDIGKCSRETGTLKDLKGLSGGERTYTSACFVMALWEVMEMPFRCMDEFDVFLDMNNRKIVMELFVDLATRQYPHNQFLFFTPQAIADFAYRNRVQLFEMPEVRN